MTENEQTPPAGDVPAPPKGEKAAAGEGGPDAQQAGGPGAGQGASRRRRRRRGRRGRGGQPGQGAQGALANGQPAAAPGNGSAAAPAGAQPQAQPEAVEEVEGVLQFEGKGLGWLRDPKRSYLPQPLDVEVPRWLVERMHLQPGVLVKGAATVRNMKRTLTRVD